MKLRVEQIGEMYYPQYRRMCIWKNFYKWVGYETEEVVKFANLEEAAKYAKQFNNKIYEVE